MRGCAGCLICVLTASLLCSGSARAEDASSNAALPSATAAAKTPTPVDGLGADLRDAFTGANLLWYGGAIAATGIMAFSGADHAIRVGVQRDLSSPVLSEGAFYTGYLLPAVLGSALYGTGLLARDSETAGAGSAVLQALGITVVATGLLKLAAGRPYPLNDGDPHAPDRLDHPEYARLFRPFQTVWPLPSWPSGHASTTVCLAAALTAYYPEKLWIPIVGYSLALLVGFGMIDGDTHWASDVVAGSLLGQAIGYSVGTAFRRRSQGAKDRNSSGPMLVPVLSPTFDGVAGIATW
jgi:membrane-associated phospholipid phosphatase